MIHPANLLVRSITALAISSAGLTGAAACAQSSAPAVAPNVLTRPEPDTVSPEGRRMAAALANAPQPDPPPPVAALRQAIGGMQDAMGARLRARYDVRVEMGSIAGVPVRIVYPKGVAALGRGPVLLNLHGGGFQLDSGSLTETIPIAAMTGLPVVAVLYRLAPEHPYPAALDDALAVYMALERDRPRGRIAVFGTSAGAALSGQLVARLNRLGRPMPAALGYFSGSADLSTSGDSESWMPLPGGARTMTESVAGYVGATPVTDPVLSPLRGNVARFPPTLLVTSTRDMLLSATSILSRRLMEAGVDARLVVFDGLPHAFWAYMDIPETDQANALMASFLKRRVTVAGR